jgi:transposase-like protein
MSKYSKEFKLAVIQHYLSGRGGFKTIADQYGVKYAHVRKWVHAFKAHGQESFVQGHTKYSGTFKLSVLQQMKQHQLSINQAASQFNIPAPSTISRWQRLYNEGGITALEPKPRGRPSMPKRHEIQALLAKPSSELTPDELLRKLHYLEVENAYLKKLQALAQQKYLASKSKPKSSLS